MEEHLIYLIKHWVGGSIGGNYEAIGFVYTEARAKEVCKNTECIFEKIRYIFPPPIKEMA